VNVIDGEFEFEQPDARSVRYLREGDPKIVPDFAVENGSTFFGAEPHVIDALDLDHAGS
jgi:hypothetical protein